MHPSKSLLKGTSQIAPSCRDSALPGFCRDSALSGFCTAGILHLHPAAGLLCLPTCTRWQSQQEFLTHNMTTRELMQQADQHPLVLATVWVALPALTWLLGQVHQKGKGGETPWKYLYSVLVYLACVPGMFAAVISCYVLFFSRENFLDLSLLVSILPIVAMVVTLVFVRKYVAFDQVPGFDRLSGLMVMMGCSFAIALAIQKTKIWIFFGGAIEHLLILAAGGFALLKWGAYTLFRNRDEPKKSAPKFPGAGAGRP